MKNGSFREQATRVVALLALILVLPAAAQTQAAKPPNCNLYRLDEKANRIVFNDPRVIILMPSKEERQKLRAEGKPGQIFLMKSCDAPDLEGDVGIYHEAKNSDPMEKIPSAVRVIVVAEQGEWVQVKGHTSLWKGTGWVKLDDKTVLVKY